MNYEFGDVGDGQQSRARLIRQLFEGGITIAEHTEKCIRLKVWTDSELLGRAARACRNEVREALGQLVDGLPFAGPTTKQAEGKPLWQQMELWEQSDYFYNCELYADRVASNLEVHNRIAAACWQRYNAGPPLLHLVEEMNGDTPERDLIARG